MSRILIIDFIRTKKILSKSTTPSYNILFGLLIKINLIKILPKHY